MNKKILIASLFAALMLLVPMTSVVGVSDVEEDCGCYDTYIYAIYKNNGTLKWKSNTHDWCSQLSIGNDGTIYCGNKDGHLYAVYSNGTRRWRKSLGLFVIPSPAIAEDGTIIVSANHYSNTNRGDIYSINPNGTINWKYPCYYGVIQTSPAIDKYGIIYFVTRGGKLLSMNPDGTLRWSFESLDASLTSSVAIGEDGTIYFGSQTETYIAKLYAVEPLEGNSPPEKPSIDGPTQIRYNKEYTYRAVTTDPDGDKVSYFFDWGDRTNSGWTELHQSGIPVSRSHKWSRFDVDLFTTIRVRAKDEHGAWGEWVRLTVKLNKPRNRATYNSLFLQILEQFPILQKILLLQHLGLQ